jgi:hypothetical protein
VDDHNPDVADYMEAAGLAGARAFAERRARAVERFYPTTPDDELARKLQVLIDNVMIAGHGVNMKRRSLFVVGPSNTGKTRSLLWQFANNRAFMPYVDRTGKQRRPLISVKSPSPYSNKEFARTIIEEIQQAKFFDDMTETKWFDELEAQIVENKVYYLWVDEAQHGNRWNTPAELEHLQNNLKMLVEMKWPLNVIYSGVNDLTVYLRHKDRQIANRANTHRTVTLKPGDFEMVRKMVQTVAADYCGVKIHKEVLEKGFILRLIHATGGCHGSIIEMTRNASFTTYGKDPERIDKRHFAREYSDNTGCLPSENVFTAAHWETIEPAYALADLPTNKDV